MKLSSAGRTHVGRRRPHNEDSFRLLREDHLFIVADGMGGHASGELASQMSVEAMTEFFRATAADPELTWPEKTNPDRSTAENRIAGGIQLGNRRIWERATREGQHRGMGTTVVAAWFDGTRLYIGHVGDSRAYRWRDGQLLQLTEDHSLLNDFIKARHIRPEDASEFPFRNVLSRAVGTQESVPVDVTRDDPRAGDLYLLCSDGLSGMVSDDDIARVLRGGGEPEALCERLIDAANAGGGADNITVVLIRCDDDAAPAGDAAS